MHAAGTATSLGERYSTVLAGEIHSAARSASLKVRSYGGVETPSLSITAWDMRLNLRRLSRGAACAFFASFASCVSLASDARDAYSKSSSCPTELVSVRRRADVGPHTLWGLGMQEPSPDIAADPVRLRFWQQVTVAKTRQRDDLAEVYEVRGCGAEQLLCCWVVHSKEGDESECGLHCHLAGEV
jgi:hypothetical protein